MKIRLYGLGSRRIFTDSPSPSQIYQTLEKKNYILLQYEKIYFQIMLLLLFLSNKNKNILF